MVNLARLPKSLIKKYGISKKAWRIFKARKRTSRKTARAKPKRRRRKTTMTRRKRRRGGKSMSQSIMKLARAASLLAPAAQHILSSGSGQEKAKWIIRDYTGWNMDTDRFEFQYLARGWLPYVAVSLVTHAIPKINGFLKRLF